MNFNTAQRRYDAMTPPDPSPDPTEDMTPEEYGAALDRWMQAGAPEQVTFGAVPVMRSRCDDVHRWLVDFLRREGA